MVRTTCAVRECKSSAYTNKKLRFHQFPHSIERCKLWARACSRPDLVGRSFESLKNTYICSLHFEKRMYGRKSLKKTATPTLLLPSEDSIHTEIVPKVLNDVNEPNVQPLPGPSRIPTTQTSDTNKQCRFCGYFTKCVLISNKPYISNNTTLAFNDVTVQLDFSDQTLPKTVCQGCDAKLTEMYDFVKAVKAAQESLINVAEPRQVYVEIDPRKDYETFVVKTEYDDDEKDEDDGNDESKDGIVDSLTIGETIFIKEEVNRKRKSKTAGPKKQKKAKVTEVKVKSENEDELIMDIKEEVIERDAIDLESDTGCFVRDTGCSVSGTGTDAKPREVELATSALVFGMRSDGSGYGYS
ncbi:uncharacterized protein LOC134676898 [Cydia fagiglandana]|uniref:uncharacterized protein LOC134676898 n=1 Tax=Cydia fagiglandana TaxID=1458189 RepID=UPI002FEE27A6